jgi:hypothetical protein
MVKTRRNNTRRGGRRNNNNNKPSSLKHQTGTRRLFNKPSSAVRTVFNNVVNRKPNNKTMYKNGSKRNFLPMVVRR